MIERFIAELRLVRSVRTSMAMCQGYYEKFLHTATEKKRKPKPTKTYYYICTTPVWQYMPTCECYASRYVLGSHQPRCPLAAPPPLAPPATVCTYKRAYSCGLAPTNTIFFSTARAPKTLIVFQQPATLQLISRRPVSRKFSSYSVTQKVLYNFPATHHRQGHQFIF